MNKQLPVLYQFSLLLLLGLIWGTGYSIARFATTHGISPLGYSFWQTLGPAILLSLFIKIKQPPMTPIVYSFSLYRYYFISGLTGIVIPNTTMYFCAPHLPAGILAVIVNTVPIITYPIALASRTESFHWTRLLGVLFAITGLMFLLLLKTSLPSAAMIPWTLIVLIAPLSFACCAVYIFRSQPTSSKNALSHARGMLVFASVILLPFVWINHSIYYFHFPLTTPDWIVLLEIVLSSTGYVLFFKLIQAAGPLYYSLVDTIVSLTGLFWGWLLFHESLNAWTSAAVMFILIGLFFVTQQQKIIVNSLEFAKN